MLDYIGRTVLIVDDYDEAVTFYRDKLGFEVLFDAAIGNGYRAVHVGLPGGKGAGLWLKEARDPASRQRLGNQVGGGPFLVVYTSDCRAACRQLEERGVRILKQPHEEPGSVFAHFEDLYGNELVLVELTGDGAAAQQAAPDL